MVSVVVEGPPGLNLPFLFRTFKVSAIMVYFLIFRSVDHQWNFDCFATGGVGVDI
ncbi:unnamed protein product [Prunus brigantina]